MRRYRDGTGATHWPRAGSASERVLGALVALRDERFTDFLDNPETLTSDPWPALESVQWPVDSACATPSELVNETHDQVWTAQMGVGARVSGGETISYGYGTALSGSTLSDTTFTLGTSDYTVSRIEVSTVTGSVGTLLFGTPEVTTTGLALHVCAATLEFSDATYNSALSGYLWTSTGLDWSMVQTPAHVPEQGRHDGAGARAGDGQRIDRDADLRRAPQGDELGPIGEDLDPIQFKPVGEDNSTVSNIRAGVEPGARNVTFSIAPPGRYGQTFAMLYRSGKTTAATRIQDPAGNDAAAFTTSPVTIENTTPEGPSVEAIAFAGDEEPYGIGATIAIDVTFNESVRVTSGRPTLALEVGENTRSAVWKSGQSAGATHRFEYTVVEGELDIDGPEVPTNGLAAAGATIRTTTGNKAVALGHGAVAGGANRAVDAVRPTMASAEVAGPTLTVTWDETLDETSVPENTGGFRVKVCASERGVLDAVALTYRW